MGGGMGARWWWAAAYLDDFIDDVDYGAGCPAAVRAVVVGDVVGVRDVHERRNVPRRRQLLPDGQLGRHCVQQRRLRLQLLAQARVLRVPPVTSREVVG